VNSVSDEVLRLSLAYLSVQNWFKEDVYVKIWPKLAHPFQNRRFPIDIRSERLSRKNTLHLAKKRFN